jgi:hypothetical protein
LSNSSLFENKNVKQNVSLSSGGLDRAVMLTDKSLIDLALKVPEVLTNSHANSTTSAIIEFFLSGKHGRLNMESRFCRQTVTVFRNF